LIASRISDSAVERAGTTLPTTPPKSNDNPASNFTRQLLHAPIVGEAVHFQMRNAAVACAEQRALEQLGADAMALPGLLNAEGGLALARQYRAVAAQFGGATQYAVDEETMHHHARAAGRCRMPGDDFIGHCAEKRRWRLSLSRRNKWPR